MRDPNKATDRLEQTSADKPRSDSQTSVQASHNISGKSWLRFCLLLGVLTLLVVLLINRDELRQDAAKTTEAAARYLAFDVMGWSPRELFILRLRFTGLLDSPLGQQWVGAVEEANKSAVQTGAAYRSVNDFSRDEIEADVYQLTLEQGQKLMWHFSRLDAVENELFASLERRAEDNQNWTTVTDLDAGEAIQSHFVAESGDYRFVLQPELFASAEYSLAVAHGGSLPFPVESASQRDIGSVFGDPRDGGARQHHGVDIFAEKRTPVTAVIDGQARTGTGGIGGKHIWLTGGLLGLGSARYYYAHLDDFAVASGDEVQKGEIIGYVGNTGNARTTPPHLHFGIYAGGPVDPAPYLRPEPELPSR